MAASVTVASRRSASAPASKAASAGDWAPTDVSRGMVGDAAAGVGGAGTVAVNGRADVASGLAFSVVAEGGATKVGCAGTVAVVGSLDEAAGLAPALAPWGANTGAAAVEMPPGEASA